MHNNLSDTNLLVRKIDRLRGMSDQLINQKAKIINEISSHNKFLDKKEKVSDVLQVLQERAQAKTKTVYEELLTKIIHEVKGYDKENHKVTLNTKVKNSRPWLDIEIENDSGYSRDIYLDKGGSIENIVAMGLRFITLSRTANRRVLLFDEADKELNPCYVPAIARMLNNLSKEVGIQVVYVTHHDPIIFEGYSRIINFSRTSQGIETEIVSDISDQTFEEDSKNDNLSFMEDVGIKYIRLVNVKQHKNTMIELSPLVTVITGDNDVGKSTVIQAIDSVNKNKGRDGLITDGQSFCRIEIGLEDDISLSWSYKKRGSKKTRYSLTDSENIEFQSSDSGTLVPEWLADYLGMSSYKDFDLHVNDKHSASFILDPKVSGHKRAEILSLGKETNQVMSMIKSHNTEIEKRTKKVNQLKHELKDVKNNLEVFRHLFSAEEIIEKANNIKKEIHASNLILGKLKEESRRQAALDSKLTVVRQIGKIQKINLINIQSLNPIKLAIENLQCVSVKNDVFSKTRKINDLNNVKLSEYYKIAPLAKSIGKLRAIQDLVLKTPNKINKEPVYENNNKIIELSKKIVLINEKNKLMMGIPAPITNNKIKSVNLSGIISIGATISDKKKEIELQNHEIEIFKKDVLKSNDEKEIIMSQLGDECPICGEIISFNKHKEVTHEKV